MTDTDRNHEPPGGSRTGRSQTPPPDQPDYETGGLRLALLVGAMVVAGLWWGWPVLLMILGIVVMIFLHELGHYLTAKWAGMKVTEFFIGFGPKIWSFQRGETEYGFTVLPAGAQRRTIRMNNPAEAAGLQEDDRIVAIDGQPVTRFEGLSTVIESHDVGDEVRLTLERDGSERTAVAELRPRPDDGSGEAGSPFLGVGTSKHFSDDPIGLGTAIVRAPGEMLRFSGQSLGALAGVFSPSGISDFANNVGEANDPDDAESGSGSGSASEGDDDGRLISIIGVVQIGSQDGIENRAAFLLALFFQINVFIGIFNMVPLPPLDGGHAAVAIYERIRSRAGRRYHADVAKLLPLTYAVVMGLVVVGVTSMYLDIVNPISG